MNKRLITTLSIGILSLSMLVGCSDSESNNVIEDNNIVKEEKYEYDESDEKAIKVFNDNILEIENKKDKSEQDFIKMENIFYTMIEHRVVCVGLDMSEENSINTKDFEKYLLEINTIKKEVENHTPYVVNSNKIKDDLLVVTQLLENSITALDGDLDDNYYNETGVEADDEVPMEWRKEKSKEILNTAFNYIQKAKDGRREYIIDRLNN